MENVHDVALWFLTHEPMTHKKIQKLCYYAQAWHCTLFQGERLFEDEIQAWIHGPVIPEIYRKYADYGWSEIPKHEGPVNICDSSLEILNAVYNTYGHYSGDQLERLTHSEDPWKNARIGFDVLQPCTNAITIESMREYYGKIYSEAQND